MHDRLPGPSAGVLVSVILLTAIGGGCRESAAPAAPPPPTVTVARPVQREVIEWDDYTGFLEAKDKVEVRARVSGFIEKADFEEGKIVQEGEPLFVIDKRPFQAELEAAQAEVAKNQAQVAYAANEFKRLEQLRPTGGASELELENARQRLREAEADVAAAQAKVKRAGYNVDWCRVTAPIAGRVSRKYVTAGNLITGGDGAVASAATLLTTITSLHPIYGYIDVDEQSVLKYQRLSQEKKRVSARDMQIPVFMGLSSEEGFPHEGVVDFVDNVINPETGTLRGRGVFANRAGYLTPGMFARVRIPGSGRYTTLLVPEVAIGTDQDQRFVLVVKDDGTVDRKPLKLGAQFGRFRAIEEGLSLEDRVIINGLQRTRPGAKVKAEEQPLDASKVPLTAPGSPATQSLPTTRRLPATRSVVPATVPASAPADPSRIGAAS